jgi:hypothetical protein
MNLVREESLKYFVRERYQKGLSGKWQNNLLEEKTQWENAMYYRLKVKSFWLIEFTYNYVWINHHDF